MTTLAPTLYARTFPRVASWLRDLILIVSSTLFVAIFAQVKIPLPFTPIPLTGQTFAVLLIAAVLGPGEQGHAIVALGAGEIDPAVAGHFVFLGFVVAALDGAQIPVVGGLGVGHGQAQQR